MSAAEPGSARTKHCLVVYATRERQYRWRVELGEGASVENALAAARSQAGSAKESLAIPWRDAEVGIFGEPCSRASIPEDGDRIELYRPLASDPRKARRERVRRDRRR